MQSAQSQVHAEQVEVLKLVQARSRADERRNQLGRDLDDLVRLDATEREHLARAETEQARAVDRFLTQHAARHPRLAYVGASPTLH